MRPAATCARTMRPGSGARRFGPAALAMIAVMAPAALAAQTTEPPTPAVTVSELVKLVAEQKRALEDQRRALDEQQREIDDLRKRLEETMQLSLSAHNRLEEMAKAAPAPGVSTAVEERLAKIEESVQRVPELPSDVVSAGEFPGSMKVPGTDVAMKIGGLVRVTAVDTFGPLGTEDRFVTSSIPVAGTPEAGKEPRFVLSPIPSRVNLDVRTPTGVGAMRAFVEGDFAGSSRVFRLRHAYGQWNSLILGQTWSTFADPEAEPDGIDFEGLNAIALFRQPLVRWTRVFGAGFSLAAAIENPAPDITNAKGVSQVPDVVVRGRWEPAEGKTGPFGLARARRGVHVNLALLFRQLRGEPLEQPNTTLSTGGFGAGLSGRLTAPWEEENGQLTFSAYAGSGIGRYITDLGTLGGQDAYYNAETNAIDALPVFAWYLGYERRWDAKLRSTFTYGSVVVTNTAAQPGSSFHMTNRWSLNLTWSPIPRVDLVGEFLFGNRTNKDGQKGSSSQLQLGTNFRF